MKVILVNPLQMNLVNKRGCIYNRTWSPLDLANCAGFLEEEGPLPGLLKQMF
jgi:anaerobic magnesium-protoporphyrin IX monomethyl ester cyclase